MKREEEMIAYALEIEPSLLPYIPELLADLDELGSDAEMISAAISALNLPKSAEVIDLGCGKGAVAVEVASELGLKVTGVELFAPFVTACEELARVNGVDNLCTFVHGDILKKVGVIAPVDVAIFAALGDVLGRLDETIATIREYVKPGGYILVSDVFLVAGGSSDYPGFEQYAAHDETIARLTAHGDKLVQEILEDEDDEDDEDDEQEETGHDESALILKRARVIAAREPEVADAVLEFAASQAAENEFIEANLVDALWVLKRA
ncbi:MAG: methyltransferase domain-containing protein [Pseudomonadales bacterium]|nr:methyltransferase domain-containing protein [Pseudomonadales bacterium]